MQIKGLKIWLIIVAIIVVLGLLVGGSYLYNKYNTEQPLFKLYENVIEVKDFELKQEDNKLEIALELNKVQNLQNFYQEVDTETKEILANQEYTFILKGNTSEELEEISNEGQFVIYESLVKGNFREMATELKNLAQANGAEAFVFMDENNVYIQIQKDDKYLYEVIEWQSNYSGDGMGRDNNA